LLFAALALCLAAPPAAAQDAGESGESVGEPLRLGPEEPATPQAGESEDRSAGTSADSDSEDGPDAETGLAGEDAEGIEVDRLDDLATGTIGVLDPGAGGFPADMWKGTARSAVEALIPKIPGDIRTPGLRELTRRLLLSSAAAPVRQQALQSPPGNLLKLRAERLAALGETDGLIELLRVVPQRFNDTDLTRLHVEALFLAHEPQKACPMVREAVAGAEAVFWQKALAICQIHDGQPDQAGLTVPLFAR
jgi:hypothetical protein